MTTLALTLLLEAAESQYGLVVATNSVKRLAAALQSAIDSHGPTFQHLSVEPSRDDPSTELWIVKRDA